MRTAGSLLVILLSLSIGYAPVYAESACDDEAACLDDCGDDDQHDCSDCDDGCTQCACCPVLRVVVPAAEPLVLQAAVTVRVAPPESTEPALSAPSDGIFQPPRA